MNIFYVLSSWKKIKEQYFITWKLYEIDANLSIYKNILSLHVKDRETWLASVHGVTKSWARLKEHMCFWFCIV